MSETGQDLQHGLISGVCPKHPFPKPILHRPWAKLKLQFLFKGVLCLPVFVGVYVYVQTASGEFTNNTAETAGSEKSTWPVPFYAAYAELARGLREACADF